MAVRIRTAWRVSSLLGPFRQIHALLSAAESLRFLKEDDTEPITGCVAAELPNLGRLKGIARWVSRDPLAAGEIVAALWEYLNLLFLLDVNALYFAAGELRRHGAALRAVIAAVGDIDAAISVASYRAGCNLWTRPHFHEIAAPAVFEEIRHPLIEDAVPNSIVLGPPHGVLVTGSNMSGKSTFLRTIGVNAVLAQTINTCLAARYEAPIFDVRTCIGKADDFTAGKSYYLVEIEAVLALVRASASSKPHLFLFDELFRGTNAVERIAAGEAVLRELIEDHGRCKPHIVLAATHDAELGELLQDTYSAYHFTDTIGPNGLVFEYHLQSGPATTRNAIALLELNGAPSNVVHRALERATALDKERSHKRVSSDSA
jgi:DNA mismatch repair ATPase MutS